eukprot:2894360-Prymnesium_polylepis.1
MACGRPRENTRGAWAHVICLLSCGSIRTCGRAVAPTSSRKLPARPSCAVEQSSYSCALVLTTATPS